MPDVGLLDLFERVRAGDLAPAAAFDLARGRPAVPQLENIGFARIDHDRASRCGRPEVIFGQGKTPEQVAGIFARLAAAGGNVLATRIAPEAAALVLASHPGAVHHQLPRCVTLVQHVAAKGGAVGVVCAGTSDLPVAEEAAVTCELFGEQVTRVTDVGVAGLHRLLAEVDTLRRMDVLVVCAGMEGALPSVVGGLVSIPVLAVPTSVGYGASLGGITALLGMLNSCASNVSVVNIDNGFGAGYMASLIASGRRVSAE